MRFFPFLSLEDQTNALARHLPSGPLYEAAWRDKPGDTSEFRKLLQGFAPEMSRLDELMELILQEHDPRFTELFLDSWESAVGIPDECFDGNGSDELRRQNIVAKLCGLSIQTRQEFIDLAALFGFTVIIKSGAECGIFPLEFPICFFDSPKTAKHTMIVIFQGLGNFFPLPFPIEFRSGIENIVTCLFDRARPASVNVIYKYDGVVP